MSGLEYARDESDPSGEDDDESDLHRFIQDAAEEFATHLYTMVGQTMPTDEQVEGHVHDHETSAPVTDTGVADQLADPPEEAPREDEVGDFEEEDGAALRNTPTRQLL